MASRTDAFPLALADDLRSTSLLHRPGCGVSAQLRMQLEQAGIILRLAPDFSSGHAHW